MMKKYTDDEVTKMIFGDFVREAGIKNPLTGEPLSKQKRMGTMYGYVSNSIWKIPISLENRILASKLITAILEENDNLDLKKSLEKLPQKQEMDEFKFGEEVIVWNDSEADRNRIGYFVAKADSLYPYIVTMSTFSSESLGYVDGLSLVKGFQNCRRVNPEVEFERWVKQAEEGFADTDTNNIDPLDYLLDMRDAVWEGEDWVPSRESPHREKFTIEFINGKVVAGVAFTEVPALAFRTREIRDWFFKRYNDLLENLGKTYARSTTHG